MKTYTAKNKLEIQVTENDRFAKDIEVDTDGIVYVNKKTIASATMVFKKYASFTGAKAAAKRLAKKLETATSDNDYNIIVDKWYA